MGDKNDILGLVWSLLEQLLDLIRKVFKNAANDDDTTTDEEA